MKKISALSEPIKVLRLLQAFGYKSAILAGGAIRDDYTGVETSDYDIFLQDPRYSNEFMGTGMDTLSRNFLTDREREFNVLFSPEVECIYDTDSYGPKRKDENGVGAQLTSIWNMIIEYNEYQLIYTYLRPTDHVNKYFDIGLCKAYCDGNKIRYTADFLRDIKNRTMTVVAQDMTQEQFNYALDHHVNKLEWKYPGYRLEVEPHNQKLYTEYNRIQNS